VVEQNRDGQVADLVRLEVGDLSLRIHSVRHMDGLPIDADAVTEPILARERAARGSAVAQGVGR
jgi:hypothetical protein